jgi:hypothetical protein
MMTTSMTGRWLSPTCDQGKWLYRHSPQSQRALEW